MLELGMLMRSFRKTLLKNWKDVLLENTLMILLLFAPPLTQVLKHVTNALTTVLRDRLDILA